MQWIGAGFYVGGADVERDASIHLGRSRSWKHYGRAPFGWCPSCYAALGQGIGSLLVPVIRERGPECGMLNRRKGVGLALS